MYVIVLVHHQVHNRAVLFNKGTYKKILILSNKNTSLSPWSHSDGTPVLLNGYSGVEGLAPFYSWQVAQFATCARGEAASLGERLCSLVESHPLVDA